MEKFLTQDIIEPLIGIILILIGTYLIIKTLKFSQKRLLKKYEFSNTTQTGLITIFNTLRTLLYFVSILAILQVCGINVSGIIAGLGLVSAIVGLALQDEIKDLVMGVHILLGGYFKVGDVIEYNGIRGKVINYSLKTTTIIDEGQKNKLIISNRNISDIKLVNGNVDLDIPVGYDEDIDHTKEVFEKCITKANASEGIELVYKGIQSFGDSAVLYRLTIHSAPDRMDASMRIVNDIIYTTFNEEHIQIPYPQLTIHQ